MHIPHELLEPETLQALLEEFATRDGTDYGAQEASLASKVEQLRLQLIRGEVAITFDADSGTCNLVPRNGR